MKWFSASTWTVLQVICRNFWHFISCECYWSFIRNSARMNSPRHSPFKTNLIVLSLYDMRSISKYQNLANRHWICKQILYKVAIKHSKQWYWLRLFTVNVNSQNIFLFCYSLCSSINIKKWWMVDRLSMIAWHCLISQKNILSWHLSSWWSTPEFD